jgi:HEAT repeat protein
MPDAPEISKEATKKTDEVDKEEVRSAKEVLQFVTKTTKTLKIYLSNNPIHQKFLSDLKEKFEVHFKTFGPLHLKVRQFELLCSGVTVYENINRLESLAFRLFSDGIREITFSEGLTPEEIIHFLEILGKDSEHASDDDTVTLLWEKSFTHIRYLVAEDNQGQPRLDQIDATNPPTATGNLPGVGDQIRTMVEQETPGHPGSNGSDEGAGSPTIPLPELAQIEIPNLSVFQLNEEDIEHIKQEVHREEESDLIQKLQDILFDILRIEREPVLFGEVVGILDNVLNTLMMRGDFFHARRILEFYWEMTDPLKGLPAVLLDRMTGAIQKAGDGGRIRSLESVLNSESFNDIENFFSFLVLLDKNVVGPLADLLGHTSKMRIRRTLCDALIELGKMDLDTVIAKLNVENWHIVRNLVYVLGKIGDPRVLDVFHRVARHPEVKVRKELIAALDSLDHPKAASLLLDFFEDPDSGIRISALKSIAKRNYKETHDALRRIIGKKEFEGRDLYEKKEFFDVIGRISGNDMIPDLRHLLLQKGFLWIRNVRQEEMGLCAVVALQRIGTPEALDALKEGQKHSSKAIREACAKALDLF